MQPGIFELCDRVSMSQRSCSSLEYSSDWKDLQVALERYRHFGKPVLSASCLIRTIGIDQLNILGKLVSLLHLMLATEEHAFEFLVLRTNVAVRFSPLILCGIGRPCRHIFILGTLSWYSGPLVLGFGVVRVIIELLRLGPMSILDTLLCLFFHHKAVDLVRDIRERRVVAIGGHRDGLAVGVVTSVLDQSGVQPKTQRGAVADNTGKTLDVSLDSRSESIWELLSTGGMS